jgi:hypothetical protein
MVRDGIANMVIRLQESGFDPHRVGPDSWESRCPAHRSMDCVLSITRNEFNHVVLECRSSENCQHIQIIRALGYTNDHVYAETPDWLIRRLSRVSVQSALFQSGTQPPHPNPLPGGARAISGPDHPSEREETVFPPRPHGERSAAGRVRGSSQRRRNPTPSSKVFSMRSRQKPRWPGPTLCPRLIHRRKPASSS